MEPIIKVDGEELRSLLDGLKWAEGTIHSLRFAIDGDCVKVKINGGTWSPPLGKVEK